MKLLISGGTGFIGKQLITALLKEKNHITVVGRDVKKIHQFFSSEVEAISWNSLVNLDPNHFDATINLAGENIGGKRWSDRVKQLIKESRVKSTNAIFHWCTRLSKPITIYNASAIGIYGLKNSTNPVAPYTEDTVINWGHPTDFLSEVGQAWEQTACKDKNPFIRMVFLRFAPVLHQSGGVLQKMLPIFKCGLGGRVGNGQQPFSWIHLDDAVAAIQFLLKHADILGPINICAPNWVSQHRFAKELAHSLHRPAIIPTPAWVLKLVFGQMADELLLAGQATYPKKLLQHQFKFLYPTLDKALQVN